MGKDKKRTKRKEKSTILDEETFGYYTRVSETLKGEFENEEEKGIFIQNVLKTISEEALAVSKDQTVSTIVEEVIRLADRNQLTSILSNFSQDWETACCDRCASFVMQSLILQSSVYLGRPESNRVLKTTETKSLEDLFNELYEFLKSQIAFYMQHVSASHVLRVIVEVLAGKKVSEMIIRSKMSRPPTKPVAKYTIELKALPAQYIQKFNEICTIILDLPKLEDHVRNNLSNPVLQTVLLSLKSLNEKTASLHWQQMMTRTKVFEVMSEDGLPESLTHEIGSRLVEQFVTTMPSVVFNEIMERTFKGRLCDIARQPVANFILQRLISRTEATEQLEMIFEELSSELESILALEHFGVIVRLTEACVRHKTLQGKLLKSLQSAFHCESPAERQCKLVPLLTTLSTYEVFYQTEKMKKEAEKSDTDSSSGESDNEEEEKKVEIKMPTVTDVNFHGSIIIQNLLKFINVRPIVNSLFEMKPIEIKNVCCDPCGSHVIEAFITSETVGEKSRETLYNKLKGFYLELACQKSGSRTFDALWGRATLKQKCTIAEELAKHEDRLKGNKFGFFIHSKCTIRNFKSRPNEWKDVQNGAAKKRKLIQEIEGDSVKKRKTTKTT